MTTEQNEHANKIAESTRRKLLFKYAKGAAEHGGNLWENSATWLIDQAIDEAIDQIVYLTTLKEAIELNQNMVPNEFDNI